MNVGPQRAAISRPDFERARLRLMIISVCWALLSASAFGVPLVVLPGDLLCRFGETLRTELQNDALVGVVGALAFGVPFILWAVILILPLNWLDRRFGLRCPSCGQSLMVGAANVRLYLTGQCGRCQTPLFEPLRWDGPAEIRKGHRRVFWMLISVGAASWIGYGAAMTAPVGIPMVAEVLAAAFALAWMGSLLTGGISIYAAIRTRKLSFLAAAALCVPLAALCLWHVFFWPTPGNWPKRPNRSSAADAVYDVAMEESIVSRKFAMRFEARIGSEEKKEDAAWQLSCTTRCG